MNWWMFLDVILKRGLVEPRGLVSEGRGEMLGQVGGKILHFDTEVRLEGSSIFLGKCEL